MKIESFKADRELGGKIASKEFNFYSQFTAIIGNNGSGKTKLLGEIFGEANYSDEYAKFMGAGSSDGIASLIALYGTDRASSLAIAALLKRVDSTTLWAINEAATKIGICEGLFLGDRGELRVKIKDCQLIDLALLGGGIKSIISMFADIACRIIRLNPHLEKNALQETLGLVLIDEVEIHLHPKQQRTVVSELRAAFPQVQFIVTTNSEYIVQSLRDGELIDLDSPDFTARAEHENKSIEYIAENVMDVPTPYRSDLYQRMMEVAQKYYKIIKEADGSTPEEIERLKAELDELIEPFSNNVAYHAFLKMERAAALREGN
jgi:predicted ATP-binding protein involved in virulence